jgi:hypothetical protein
MAQTTRANVEIDLRERQNEDGKLFGLDQEKKQQKHPVQN